MGALSTFLKVIGKIAGVLPLAVRLAGVVGTLVSPGKKTGPTELAAVKEIIRDAIQASEFLTGKELINEQLLDQGITKMANGAVDVMNAVKPGTGAALSA